MNATDVIRLAVLSPIGALGPAERRRLFDRTTSTDPVTRDRTRAIIDRVRRHGDDALRALARELDAVSLASLEVPRDRWRAALDRLDPDLQRALERAALNIETAHRAQLPSAVEIETEAGVIVGRRPDPLARVGVYAPGGRASYPSSVLMGAVPARVAGVDEVILCSPPRSNGVPSDVVLAAAELAEVDRVFAVGGAGAVAAMAHGTASIPRVDRIIGPGNAYVAEAKLQVSDMVAIDSPAGPSELLAIADAAANPDRIAREMLAQAEHDPRACAIAVAIGESTAARLLVALENALEGQARLLIITQALASRGAILIAEDVADAVRFANEYGPEHLLLAIDGAEAVLRQIRNAGTVFVGESSSVTFGDYLTGANHVLPTGGLARSWSGLSVLDFVRWTTWQKISREAAARLAGDVGTLADAEGLPAHAAAARAWRSGGAP